MQYFGTGSKFLEIEPSSIPMIHGLKNEITIQSISYYCWKMTSNFKMDANLSRPFRPQTSSITIQISLQREHYIPV